MDATNIGQNFTVLSIHVLYRGCGIPVAWKIIKIDGWQWHKTRLRAERLWLAIAVATFWTVTMGSDEAENEPQISQLKKQKIAEFYFKSEKKKSDCHISVFYED